MRPHVRVLPPWAGRETQGLRHKRGARIKRLGDNDEMIEVCRHAFVVRPKTEAVEINRVRTDGRTTSSSQHRRRAHRGQGGQPVALQRNEQFGGARVATASGGSCPVVRPSCVVPLGGNA